MTWSRVATPATPSMSTEMKTRLLMVRSLQRARSGRIVPRAQPPTAGPCTGTGPGVWDADDMTPELRGLFAQRPGYLDTASLGVPPSTTVTAMRKVLDGWQHGRVGAPDFDEHVRR